MKKIKASSFLFWACRHFFEVDYCQAVLMKFKFGREKAVGEISFLCLKKSSSEIIYGWSELRQPSGDNPKTFCCCSAPLGSRESDDYIHSILLEIDDQFDSFPLPDATLTFKELKYEMSSLGEGLIAIRI
jgi:hypothetical protein